MKSWCSTDSYARSVHVLVVEDDEDFASSLSHLFRAGGFEATVVTTGRDAIAHVEMAPPDLLILDLMLPDMDGV